MASPRATQLISGRASVRTHEVEFSTPTASCPSESHNEGRILSSLGELRMEAVGECPWWSLVYLVGPSSSFPPTKRKMF